MNLDQMGCENPTKNRNKLNIIDLSIMRTCFTTSFLMEHRIRKKVIITNERHHIERKKLNKMSNKLANSNTQESLIRKKEK